MSSQEGLASNPASFGFCQASAAPASTPCYGTSLKEVVDLALKLIAAIRR